MGRLCLVHDVLDAQLVDARQRKIGRVDDVVLAVGEGHPPRVAVILVGGPVRAERIGRWMVRLAHVMRALGRVRRNGVSRIAFERVRCMGATIQVEVDGDSLESDHIESWLASNVVRRIPFGRSAAGAQA